MKVELSRGILRLHYVPGDHGSHGSPKRCAPCDLVNFCLGTQVLLSTNHYVSSRAIKVSVTNRGLNPRRHDGALRLSSRYVTDACTFPHGLSRSDGTSHVSLLYFQGLSRLSSPVKAHYG